VPFIRSRCTEYALELHSRHHIGIPPETIFGLSRRVEGVEAAGKYYSAYIQILFPVLDSIINSVGGADLFAGAAPPPGLEINAILGVDDRHKGNGLCKGDVDGPPVTEFGVEFVGDLVYRIGAEFRRVNSARWAHEGAGAATDAYV